ncbi:MAG: Ig-like domain-containing protein [Gammaproteobacteria bacterium]|nr:Ig-like domain-containing protein [Gammaproteobacteria bacterium]
MFVKWLRALLLMILVTVFGCGGGGDKSSVQVGGLTYVAHDFSASPETLNGAFATTKLALFVKEQSGSQISPYSSATVVFESPCLLDGRARVTDQKVYNGNYQANYLNLGCSGSDLVKAKVSVGGVSINPLQKTLTITNYIPPLSDLLIAATNSTMPADGTSQTQVRVRAVLQSATSTEVPVSGVTVNFSTNKGSLSATQAVTDQFGYASVMLTASTVAGEAQVTASAEGFVRNVSVRMDSLTPVSRFAVDAGVSIRPNTPVTLGVVALDAAGQTVVGANVIFDIVTNLSGGRLTTFSATTDQNGRAFLNYISGNAESNRIEDGVLVRADDVIKVSAVSGAEQLINIQVSNNDQIPASINLVSGANGETVPANNTNVLIAAQVLNLAGDPLANITVNFSSTLGTIDAMAVTDANGIAKVFLRADIVGIATVSAQAAGIVRNTTVEFVSSILSRTIGELTVTAANTNVPSDGVTQTAIRARVISAPQSGVEETRPLSGVPVSFTTTLGTLSSSNVTTDADGYATVLLVSDTQPGTAIISASAGGFVRTVSVGFGSITPPARIISTVTPSRVDPGSTATISSTVLDATGIGVPNVRLVYEIINNVSGGRLSSFSTVTNSQGIASIDYVAGNTITDTQAVSEDGTVIWVAGYDVISINTDNNVKTEANVRVNNEVTSFSSLTLTTGGSEVPADNKTKVLLQARVVDGNQQPVVGQVVGFTASLGNLVDLDDVGQSTAVTGSDGVARLYLKAGSVETDTEVKVSASYKGVISTQTITFYPNP